MLYIYKIIQENVVSGQRSGKAKQLEIDHELKVGGLYGRLPRVGKGFWRVLELVSKLDVAAE